MTTDAISMRMKVLNIQSAVQAQMCCGCGACAYLDPDAIEMGDATQHGRRPRRRTDARSDAKPNGSGAWDGDARQSDAMRVCPGIALEHDFDRHDPGLIKSLTPAWGPIRGMWEGYAGDAAIRHAGSSGGAATALALFAIERLDMHGVLHTAARKDAPHLNETVMSRSRDELHSRTGSRYAPASPCDGLAQIEQAPRPCVFIGKPCDVAAVSAARRLRPKLDERVGLTIGFFCAGTPSTRGTLEMLKAMGVDDPSTLVGLRYRGNGWPGKATATFRTPDGSVQSRELTYEVSWGDILQKHRQWRCYVCADHTGEFADIAVGDPWYRQIRDDEPGQSLILARTPHGRRVIEQAIEAGYLVAQPVKPDILPKSQPNLLRTRGSIWARIWTCRLMGAAAPRFKGMPMFRFWLSQLSLIDKVRSFTGTAKRVFRKGLRRRVTPEFLDTAADGATVAKPAMPTRPRAVTGGGVRRVAVTLDKD